MTEERAVYSSSYDVIDGVKIDDLKPLPSHVLVRWLKKQETKGGVLIPQYRWRKSYMIGQVLKTGPGCDERLVKGTLIQFNSMADKEFLGVQDPADRDTVFFMRVEDVHGIVKDHEDGTSSLDPCNEYVLIRPDQGEAEKGSLVVPGHMRKPTLFSWHGEILAVGPDVAEGGRYAEIRDLVGQRVLYTTEMADSTIINKETIEVVRADYVIGVYEPTLVA